MKSEPSHLATGNLMKIALFFTSWLVLSFVVSIGFGLLAERGRRAGGPMVPDFSK